MTKLADLTFESGSLPTGVTAVISGASTAVVSSGGLVGGSSFKGRVTQNAGSFAYFNMAMATISGGSVGLQRGIGGYMKYAAGPSGTVCRFARLMGNANATFLAQAYLASGVLNVAYASNAGTVGIVIPGVTLNDGIGHSFHLGYLCSATAGRGQMQFWIDGELVLNQQTSNSTVVYGTGVSNGYFGNSAGNASDTQTLDFDGCYLSDGLSPEVSAEGGLTGYSGTPIATRLLAMSTTAGSPTWSVDDTEVASIDGSGNVTWLNACGGAVTVRDSTGSNRHVEFARRSRTWKIKSVSQVGSGVGAVITAVFTMFTVGDGYAYYSDLRPSLVGSGCRLSATSGKSPNITATFIATGAGPYSVYLDGVLITLAVNAASPTSLTGVG